ASFLESTKAFIDVQQAIRTDPHLWRLSRDLYPELWSPEETDRLGRPETPLEKEARRTAGLHVIVQMIQVIEKAVLSLKLDGNYAHPMNRGWMDIFYRWTSAETVRRHWPLVRAEFGRDFVRFCEKQMLLGEMQGRAKRLQPGDSVPNLARLLTEFEDQWSGRE